MNCDNFDLTLYESNCTGLFETETSAGSKLEGTCHEVSPGFWFCPAMLSMTSKVQNIANNAIRKWNRIKLSKKISPEPFDEFLLPWKIVLVGLIKCQNAEVLAMFLTVALAKTPRPANAGQNEFGKNRCHIIWAYA